MTSKQQRFVQEYLLDLNATQAAIRAGYSENTAYSQGQRLLKNVDVAAALKSAQEKRSERTEITQDWVIDRLVENVERAMQAVPVLDNLGRQTGEYVYQGAVANRSLELLGKHQGMFVDRQETDHRIQVLSDEPLTEDEWERKYSVGAAAGSAESTH